MHHPKSTSHNLRGFAAFAGIALLASCAPLPGRNMTGTGGTTDRHGRDGQRGGNQRQCRHGRHRDGGARRHDGHRRRFRDGRHRRRATGTAGTGAAGTGVAGSAAGRGGSGGTAGTGTAGGGSGGAAGTGGTGGTTPPRGPTPAANGVNFPFPQNRELSRCVYPANYLNSDVMAAWAQFKTDTVTSQRRERLSSHPADGVRSREHVHAGGLDGIGGDRVRDDRRGLHGHQGRSDAVRRPVEVLAGAPEQQRPDELGDRIGRDGGAGKGRCHRRRRGHRVRASDGGQAVGLGRLAQLPEPREGADQQHLAARDRRFEAGRARRQLGADRPLEEHQHLVLRARVLPTVQGGRLRPRLGRGGHDRLRHDPQPQQHAGQGRS